MIEKDRIWRLYQLSLEYAENLCKKRCFHKYENCKEFIIDNITKNQMSKLRAFQGRSKETTYVYVVVNNLLKDFFKIKINFISYEEENLDPKIIYKEDNKSSWLTKEILDKAISTLSKEEQLIIKLRYYDGYLVKDIALLFNTSPKQMSKKINKIIKKLKKLLKREDFLD